MELWNGWSYRVAHAYCDRHGVEKLLTTRAITELVFIEKGKGEKQMKSGVLVIGHGSKLDYNRQLVVDMADRLAKMKELGPAVAAFMQLNPPTIKEGIQKLVDQGVDTIYVQPCFLASGIHLTEDIPGEIGLKKGETEAKVAVNGKNIVLRYCEPIGNDERIALILADRVRARMKKA
jgi:sirohydrochlorin cobalto/nickelchelatase